MEKPISKHTLFINGSARFHDLIYVIAKDRALAEDEIDHSRFIAFDQRNFGHMGDRNWSSSAICVAKKPTEKMIAIGEDGDVFTYVGSNVAEETIAPSPIVVRAAGVVDGYAMACGMQRQVYRRPDDDTWIEMHAPTPEPHENAGFEAIDGFSADEVYAVGWGGEIWEWDGKGWSNRVSPTSLILTGVCCADDGKVYACGQHGALIRGRHSVWETIDLSPMNEDFWDVTWFKDNLYVTTMTGIYYLRNDNLLPVNFGSDTPRTFYRLTQAEDVLWLVGSSDIFSFDGNQWTRID